MVFEFKKKPRVKFACTFECGYKATVDKSELSEEEKYEMSKARAVIHKEWKRKKKLPPKKKKEPTRSYLIDV